ncbi:hypothetical protein HDU79_004534 [Rhizoclosmatium sp. JEL0117]|nr:hypothetical protein HDU79_004534 [Rhizoclosmatium sp. JEL0117]
MLQIKNGAAVNTAPIFECTKPIAPPPSYTPAQLDLAKELLGEVPFIIDDLQGDVSPADRERLSAWATEAECNRFMRATKWDLKASRKRLADTIQWRFDYKPDLIDPAQIECEGVTGRSYISGFDKGGHPMLFLVPSNPKVADSNYDRAIRFSVYMLERAIRLMPEGVERLDLIIDYENVTRATATPLSVSLKYLNIFSSHYPERLNMGIMINPSWYLPFFLGLLSPFMDPVTKSKINMVNLKDTSSSTGTTKGTGGWIKILDYIDEDQLPTRYGGTFEFQYEHETYWPKLIAM